MYPFCKYSDGTEVVFSGIIKNDNGEETVQIHFERPTENGFDSVRFELPSYKIIDKEGNYTAEEIELFKTVVEQGAPSFLDGLEKGELKLPSILETMRI